MRDHDYSYSCECFNPKMNEWLFDLKADPKESNNIAAAKPDVVAAYRRRLEEFLGESIPAPPRYKTLSRTTPPCRIWVPRRTSQ